MAFVYILISATKLFDLETTNDSHGNAAGLESNRQKKLRLRVSNKRGVSIKRRGFGVLITVSPTCCEVAAELGYDHRHLHNVISKRSRLKPLTLTLIQPASKWMHWATLRRHSDLF